MILTFRNFTTRQWHRRHVAWLVNKQRRFVTTTSRSSKVPKFDADTFFRRLRLHQQQLENPTAAQNPWDLPWDTEVWDLMRPTFKSTPAEPVVNKKQQSSPFCTSEKLPCEEIENDNEEALLPTEVEQCDVVTRLHDIVVRHTKDYESYTFAALSKDICRVMPKLHPSRLVWILTTLSLIRSRDAVHVFISAESVILKSLGHFSHTQLVAILSAYARMEVLWGIHSEDAELWLRCSTAADTAFQENRKAADVVFPSSVQNAIPELKYYNSSPQLRASLRTRHSDAVEHGRSFFRRLLEQYSVTLQSPVEQTYEESVWLLFALLAQRSGFALRALNNATLHSYLPNKSKSTPVTYAAEYRFVCCLLHSAEIVVHRLTSNAPLYLDACDSSPDVTEELDVLAIFLLSRLYDLLVSAYHASHVKKDSSVGATSVDKIVPTQQELLPTEPSVKFPEKHDTVLPINQLFGLFGIHFFDTSLSPIVIPAKQRDAFLRRVAELAQSKMRPSSTPSLLLGHIILLELALQNFSLDVSQSTGSKSNSSMDHGLLCYV